VTATAAPDPDRQVRERNLAAVEGAFAGVAAGDAARQLSHYTDDMVLELPYADPPKRIEGKDTALAYLSGALRAFALELSVTEVHEGRDPDELVVEFTGTGTYKPTGARYDNRYIAVFGFHDGLICRQREFYDPLAAQRATASPAD